MLRTMTTNNTTTTDTTSEAARLRSEAADLNQQARDSFERCDTDGALSQWALGLDSQKKFAQARLLDDGGVAKFITLFDLDGNWVPSKMIRTQYGSRWMVLDSEGNKTGTFLPVCPKRRDTLAKHGYVEGYAMFPAKVDYVDTGAGLVGVRVQTLKTSRDHVPPTSVVTVDRWATEEGK